MLSRCPTYLALLLLIAVSSAASAQVGSVRGRVVDSTGAPLAGALLAVDRTNVRAQSASSGSYVLLGVPAGVRTIRVQVIGYAPLAVEVTVRAGETITQDLTMRRSAVQLAAVDVVVGSRASHTAADEIAVPVDIIPA
ncbi:MAG: hypothetical protein K0S86_2512, partial [Geminicoccaceae bacterium]|nr:hypothetical protein [Geminicoccaceae bacterium]